MKRILLVGVLAVLAVLVSCSGGGNNNLPPVSSTDKTAGTTALVDAQSYFFANYSNALVWTVIDQSNPNQWVLTGPYGTMTVTFSPNASTFSTNGSLTLSGTITNYYDATTGYTISGTLTFGFTFSSSALSTISYTTNFNLSGQGNIRTMKVNASFNYLTSVYSGTITLNGTTFSYP